MTAILLQRNHLTLNVRPGSACDFHRITQPFLLSDIRPKRPVFVFNRLPTFDIESVFAMRKEGVAIVVDMDDHFELDADHVLYDTYQHGHGLQLERCVRLADLVIASTPYLADQLRPFARRVEVVPNCLPYDTGMWTRSTDLKSGTPFVYAAGASHRHDFALLDGNLEGLLTVAGYEDNHVEWALMRASRPTLNYRALIPLQDWRNLWHPRSGWRLLDKSPKGRRPTMAELDARVRQRYMDVFDGHCCAIAPLRDTKFNRCKSNLKILEAGAKGIPIITSRVSPYDNALDERHVWYAETWGGWGTALNTLSKMPLSFFEDAGAALAEHVRRHYQLTTANELRRQLLEDL